MLYKPVVIATFAILAGLHLTFAADRRRALVNLSLAGAAMAAIWLAVCAYFLATGRFSDFYDIMIIHNRHYAGNMAANLLRGLHFDALFPDYLKPLTPLVILGAFGLALSLFRKGWRPWALLLGLLIGTWIAVALPGRFYRHYYQFWLPPLVVAAGWALQALGELAQKDTGSRAYPWLPRLMGIAALAILLVYELPLYRLSADQWSQRKHGDHYLAIMRMWEELGRILQPDETLYQWGVADGLYFYSQRRPASGVIFLWPVILGPLAPSLTTRVLAELKRSPPEIFITKWENLSREDEKRHPVVRWFLSHYQFWYQRGSFVLYFRPGGRLASRLGLGAARTGP
jgi:hypothetical protein